MKMKFNYKFFGIALSFILLSTILIKAQTTDNIFKELVKNDDKTREAEFIFSPPEITPIDKLEIEYLPICGGINDYKILTYGLCPKVIKEPIEKIVEFCMYVNDSKLGYEVQECNNITTIDGFEDKTIYEYGWCTPQTLPTGEYNIKVQFTPKISDCGVYGWGSIFDWLPVYITDDMEYIQNKWAWLNTTYDYRRQINITTFDSVYSDVVVKIPINSTNFDTSYNYSSIAFADENGTLLNYWYDVYAINKTANTYFYVKLVDSSPIYMYYDNGELLSFSNATNTFILYENFNDGAFEWEQKCASAPEVMNTGEVYGGVGYSVRCEGVSRGGRDITGDTYNSGYYSYEYMFFNDNDEYGEGLFATGSTKISSCADNNDVTAAYLNDNADDTIKWATSNVLIGNLTGNDNDWVLMGWHYNFTSDKVTGFINGKTKARESTSRGVLSSVRYINVLGGWDATNERYDELRFFKGGLDTYSIIFGEEETWRVITPPTTIQLNITPPNPTNITDSLNCSAIATDTMYQNLTFKFYWFHNGTIDNNYNTTVNSFNNTRTYTDKLVNGTFKVNDTWGCFVIVSNEDMSNNATNTTVTIDLYIPPPPPKPTVQSIVGYDLTSTPNVLVLGILVIIWLVCMVFGVMQHNILLLGFTWLLGSIIGIMLYSLGVIITISFLLFNIGFLIIGITIFRRDY